MGVWLMVVMAVMEMKMEMVMKDDGAVKPCFEE